MQTACSLVCDNKNLKGTYCREKIHRKNNSKLFVCFLNACGLLLFINSPRNHCSLIYIWRKNNINKNEINEIYFHSLFKR